MRWNPLLSVQARLTGGWRLHLILAGILVLVCVGGTQFSYYLSKDSSGNYDKSRIDSVWLAIIGGLQAMFALMLVPGAVRKAVLRDFESGMMESLRQTPMSSVRVMLGYLSGAPIQAYILFATGMLLGSYYSTSVNHALATNLNLTVSLVVTGWGLSMLYLLAGSMMLATMALLAALQTRGKANVLGILILISVFGGGMLIFIVPGLALLVGAYPIAYLFDLLGAPIGFPAGGGNARIASIPLTMLSQLALTVLLVTAACRKFRKPHEAMFSMGQSMLLLLLWGIMLLVGMLSVDAFNWTTPGQTRVTPDSRFIQHSGSMIAFMVIALFPLTSSAVLRWQRDRAAAFGERVGGREITLANAAPIIAMILTVGLFWLMAGSGTYSKPFEAGLASWTSWAVLVVSILIAYWTDRSVLYFAIARRWKVMYALLIIAALRSLPIAMDGSIQSVYQELVDAPRAESWAGSGYVSNASALGTIIGFGQPLAYALVGLGCQFGIALLCAMLARRARRSAPVGGEPLPIATTAALPTPPSVRPR